MDCKTTRRMIGAYADGELDAPQAREVETHIRGCAACEAELTSVRDLNSLVRNAAPYYKAPAGMVAPAKPAGSVLALVRAAAFAACLLVAAYLGFLFGARNGTAFQSGFVSAHIQALMSNRLIEVASSDKHTVKPWFNGKVDYSPPVADLAAYGFPLLGGRLDALNGQRVAVLVYGRKKHVIDLYAAPEGRLGDERGRNGYHVVEFKTDGFDFRAVSDLEEDQLRQFASLCIEHF